MDFGFNTPTRGGAQHVGQALLGGGASPSLTWHDEHRNDQDPPMQSLKSRQIPLIPSIQPRNRSSSVPATLVGEVQHGVRQRLFVGERLHYGIRHKHVYA